MVYTGGVRRDIGRSPRFVGDGPKGREGTTRVYNE